MPMGKIKAGVESVPFGSVFDMQLTILSLVYGPSDPPGLQFEGQKSNMY